MSPKWKTGVLEILDSAPDMTVATVRADGYPQATTVSFVHDGLAIYFGCAADSQKARNIEHSDAISLAMRLPYERLDQIRGLSLGGRARFVSDATERERVFAMMLARFPELADHLPRGGDEALAVVRVDPEVISLLDYRKGFGHTEEVRV